MHLFPRNGIHGMPFFPRTSGFPTKIVQHQSTWQTRKANVRIPACCVQLLRLHSLTPMQERASMSFSHFVGVTLKRDDREGNLERETQLAAPAPEVTVVIIFNNSRRTQQRHFVSLLEVYPLNYQAHRAKRQQALAPAQKKSVPHPPSQHRCDVIQKA